MNSTATIENDLRDSVRQVVKTSFDISLENVSLEIPKIRDHGDLSSSVALQLASSCKKAPLQIAQTLVDGLRFFLKTEVLSKSVDQVEVKPPGFINFFLTQDFFYRVLEEILKNGADYGRSSLGKGKKALIEFVSANPTGPLSVAHGRQAALGDALANLLDYAGYSVNREYYLNDEGTQIDLLGASILARAKEFSGQPTMFPEKGYKGEYIQDLGKTFSANANWMESPHAQDEARKFGVRELTEVIRGELDQFGVRFDQWFAQSSLRDKNYLNESLELLEKAGYLYEEEGAWWLKSTAFGDDKDRVVIRSDGRLTYIAADIAYHRRKFERHFDLVVNLWGPDHHGYIARLKAAVQALGFPPEALQIRIVQLCTLKRGAEIIPMSTREGQFITLTEVMQEVGKDAARFFFLLRKTDAHLEFDLELAKQHSLENPVYYIQYAHARIARILENWAEQKEAVKDRAPDYSRLNSREEMQVLKLLREFPGIIEVCAKSLEPFGLVSFLQGVAESFHRFYDQHRVISSDLALSQVRINLIRAVQTVLATGLRILGVSAPEKM